MRGELQLLFAIPAVGSLARSRTDVLPELALAFNTLLLAAYLVGGGLGKDDLWALITAYQVAVLVKASRNARIRGGWKPEAVLVLLVWSIVATARVAQCFPPWFTLALWGVEIWAALAQCYVIRNYRLDVLSME